MAGKHIEPEKMEWEQVKPWAKRLVVHGKTCSAVVNQLGSERKSGLHQHPHEQISYIVSGTTEFALGNKVFTVKAGDIIVIPPNIDHGGGESECTMIDFFSPRRDEYTESRPKARKKK
jgi:quercetin dioxygenase-like cupin family protein